MSRVSWKYIFAGFQLTVLEIKLTFMKRKVVFHTATLTHCEARQVLGDFFNTNQENGSEMTFVTGTNKINHNI